MQLVEYRQFSNERRNEFSSAMAMTCQKGRSVGGKEWQIEGVRGHIINYHRYQVQSY